MIYFFLAAVCGGLTGNSYFVAPTGNDANPCTAASPCRQITNALSLLQPGDTLFVADGAYLGFTMLKKIGTPSNPITIQAQGSNAYVFATNYRGDNRDNIFISYCTNIVVDGLNSTNAPRAGLRIDASARVTVRNGNFGSNATWGIFTDFSDDLVLEHNECHHSGTQHGINHSNSGDRPVIRGNYCHDNFAIGIHMNGDLSQGGDGLITGALVANNLIISNGVGGGSGINMDGVQNSIVRNNLLFGNHATGIGMFQQDGAQGPKGNQVYNNTIDQAADARWALLITQTAGTNFFRNNILYQRNPSTQRGCILFNTATDAGNTDSDYNLLGGNCFITTDNAQNRISFASWQSMGHETHSLSNEITNVVVAPLGDYHLKTNSPAIDAGQSLIAVPTDLENSVRPAGLAADMGAYEFGSELATPPVTVQFIGMNVCVSFQTRNGQRYFIERNDNLAGSGWTTVTNNVVGTGEVFGILDIGGAGADRRFYRVRITP